MYSYNIYSNINTKTTEDVNYLCSLHDAKAHLNMSKLNNY